MPRTLIVYIISILAIKKPPDEAANSANYLFGNKKDGWERPLGKIAYALRYLKNAFTRPSEAGETAGAIIRDFRRAKFNRYPFNKAGTSTFAFP